MASFRLRCQQIIRTLKEAGHEASLYAPGARAPDVLVLSKRYDPAPLDQARGLAVTAGTSLVLDLCDNHFHFDADPTGQLARRAGQLKDAIRAVHRVTTASRSLADIVRQACPEAPPISVVADAAEPPLHPGWWVRWTDSASRTGLRSLARWHQQQRHIPAARRFVWFGNHGSPGVDGGMADLGALHELLDQSLHRAGPLCLTVISNHREPYEQVTASWKLPSHYLEWSANNFSQALQMQSAALIPVTINPFTVGKTANRVLTAFQHGLNVIADTIPSNAEFRGCAVLDDWTFGLNEYSAQADRRRADLAEGARIARQQYSLQAVTAQWLEALVAARTSMSAVAGAAGPAAT